MESDSGGPTLVRVVLVDADDRVRESWCGLLCIGDRIEVVGSAGATDVALDVIRDTKPDVVVVDPRLPDLDGGIAFIDRVRGAIADVRVVALCGSDPDQ